MELALIVCNTIKINDFIMKITLSFNTIKQAYTLNGLEYKKTSYSYYIFIIIFEVYLN